MRPPVKKSPNEKLVDTLITVSMNIGLEEDKVLQLQDRKKLIALYSESGRLRRRILTKLRRLERLDMAGR